MSDLRDRLTAALGEALPPAPGTLYSLTLATPGVLFDQPPLLAMDYSFWGRPAEEHFRLGLGQLLPAAGWVSSDPDRTGLPPLAWITAPFDESRPMAGPWEGLPERERHVPELLLERRGALRAITFTCQAAELARPDRLAARWAGLAARLFEGLSAAAALAPCEMALEREAEAPSPSEWTARVGETLAAIGRGELKKLVLSRCLILRGERPFEPSAVLASLRCLYPGCTLLALRRGERTLVAASPERLASLAGGEVRTAALAGTARRSPLPAHDRALAAGLLADPKQRHEHRVVVEAIAAALGPLCEELDLSAPPELVALRTLQHLQTPIRGRAAPGVGLPQLAAALHPTPAVSGWPQGAATARLREIGEAERGWYSGYCGWMDAHGDGDLTVILRCALLHGERAHLFAGCGIVADSDAQAELAETEWKLAALIPALENG